MVTGLVVCHICHLKQPQRPGFAADVCGQRGVREHVAPTAAAVANSVAVRHAVLQLHDSGVHMPLPAALGVSDVRVRTVWWRAAVDV